MNTTQMRLIKKQIDESFTHLRKAAERRHEVLLQAIKLHVNTQVYELPEDLQREADTILEEARALQKRSDELADEMERAGFIMVDNERWSKGSNVIDITIKLDSRTRFRKANIHAEIEQRNVEQGLALNEALFRIEEERLALNEQVLSDNVEDAASVLAGIPSIEDLMPRPEYLHELEG